MVDRVFRDNAEHPPLGRWLLGIASKLGEPIEVLWKGPDPTGHYVLAGRIAPALAFAALWCAWSRLRPADDGARRPVRRPGVALLAMPRVFAHAHLAALDTFLSLFWTLALLAGDRALRSKRPVLAMAGAGALWSLALSTKIHAWFLLPIMLRLVVRLAATATRARGHRGLDGRRRSACLGWAGPGSGTIPGTGSRLTGGRASCGRRSWCSTSARSSPIAMSPGTTPGFISSRRSPSVCWPSVPSASCAASRDRRADPLPLLLAGTIVVFLVIFSTRVPVYDGERLFLHVFPAWALLIGLGFGWLWDHRFASVSRAYRAGWRSCWLQFYGVVALHPFGLSYYNGLVGGLTRCGAAGTGTDLLERPGRPGAARPAGSRSRARCHGGPGANALSRSGDFDDESRAGAAKRSSWATNKKRARAEWLVVSRRTAYWRPEIRERLRGGEGRPVAMRTRQGVWLAALWHFPPPKPTRSASARWHRETDHAPFDVPECPSAQAYSLKELVNLGPLPSSRRADDS